MSYLLDTDICSAHLKGSATVTARMMQYGGRLSISVITLGELQTWVSRAATSHRRRDSLEEFLREVEILPVTETIGRRFGELRAVLLDTGRSVPQLDLLIAATAIEHNLTLITHNLSDYEFVPGLTLDDWLKGKS